MAYSINGFGTTYYGQRDFERDGSYVTTKWAIAGTLPLLPLGSIRVKPARRGFARQEMSLVDDVGMDWLQVLWTYLYVYLCVPVSLWLVVREQHSFIEDYRLPFAVVIGVRTLPFLFVLALPHLLRWWGRRRAAERRVLR